MRTLLLASSLALAAAFAGAASAKSPTHSVPTPATVAQADSAQRSPAANDAVQVVDAFMAALVDGRIEAARQMVTPDAVVLANGHVLGDRDGYINGAWKVTHIHWSGRHAG
ncbi:hypothetical protein [Lysobacter rhizosphaerae]